MKANLISALLMLGSIPTAAFAELSTNEFFAQYEPAAQKLRAFYGAMTMSGVYSQNFVGRGSQTESRLSYQFKIYADAGRLRADLVRVEGNENKPLVTAFVVAPEKSFAVSRDEGASAFALQSLKQQPSLPDGLGIRLRVYAAFCAYAEMDGVPILDKLKESTTTITGISEERRNDEDLVTVSARFTLKPPVPRDRPPPEWIGSYIFSKTKGWALRESQRQQVGSSDAQVTCNVEYGDTINGIPVLKRGEFWRETPDRRIRMAACEVSELKPGPARQREFTLAAFGIRDVGDEKETKYWLYLIIAGVLLLAAGIVLGRVAARKRASANRVSA